MEAFSMKLSFSHPVVPETAERFDHCVPSAAKKIAWQTTLKPIQ
jgi:hypothetical protein